LVEKKNFFRFLEAEVTVVLPKELHEGYNIIAEFEGKRVVIVEALHDTNEVYQEEALLIVLVKVCKVAD